MGIKRKFLWSVVTLLLAVLTIWAVLYGSGMSPAQIIQGVSSANKVWLIPAALCMLGIIWFEGRAVLTIVKSAGYPRKRRQGFVYAAADSYFSAITPSATGGQPGSAFFMMKDGIPGAVVTASLLVNMIAYNSAILSIGALSLITRPRIFLHFQPVCRLLVVLGILVLTGMALLFFMLLAKRKTLLKISMWGLRLLSRIHLVRHPERLEEKLRDTMEEYKECVILMSGQKGMWVKAYLFNLLQRISQFCVTVFCFLAIGGKAGKLYDLWITQCYVSLGANCIPIPGSMGVTDYMMLDGYMNLMDSESAFRLQVLARGLSFYCCILLSGLTVLGVWLYMTKRGKKAGQGPQGEPQRQEEQAAQEEAQAQVQAEQEETVTQPQTEQKASVRKETPEEKKRRLLRKYRNAENDRAAEAQDQGADAGMVRRYRYTFFGDVQGVGFRWRARMAAQSLGLTGWVKNEWDGSVVLEIQGQDSVIERMLAEIDSGSFIRIDRVEKVQIRPDPQERSFKVAGY